jgi:hypothetical protein
MVGSCGRLFRFHGRPSASSIGFDSQPALSLGKISNVLFKHSVREEVSGYAYKHRESRLNDGANNAASHQQYANR